MGFDTVSSTRAMDDPARYGGTAPKIKNNGKRRKSDAEHDREHKLHGRLLSWLLQERDKQGPNRVEMATDEDFYDGLQWSDEDAAELMERGQAPLVFNQVKPTINWLLGTERRTRIDGKVLPRCEDDEEGAEVKSKLLKYLSDVNRTPFKRSQAFKAQIVAGLGWMEDALETDPSQELLATRYVDWKEIYHDSNSKELDLSDARYLFRWKFVDLDVALAICPDKQDEIRKAALDDAQMVVDDDNVWYLGAKVNSAESAFTSRTVRGIGGGYINGGREVVKLIECWYKVPVPCQVCRSDDPEAAHLNGEKWDPDNKEMADLHRAGFITVAGHTMMEVRAALMTESCLLYEAKSPYKPQPLPLHPAVVLPRHRDGLPYGVIRDIRDAQIDYNKRASKALYILSTVRVVMDEGCGRGRGRAAPGDCAPRRDHPRSARATT
jgi:hypothetical protein